MLRHLLLASVLVLPAVESPPAATVNGKPIPRREVEDALLRQEGIQLASQWVTARLEGLDWTELEDGAALFSVGDKALTRRELVALCLAKGGAGQALDDLIKIEVVRQALEQERVRIDDVVVDAEYRRNAARKAAELEAKGLGQVDFASWLLSAQKLTPAQLKAQPGFRLGAGLHELAARRLRTEIKEEELRQRYDRSPARWASAEAVELQSIFLPYDPARPAGEERARLGEVIASLEGQIRRGETPFELIWKRFASSWDADAGEGGRLGWVERDGIRRQQPGARRIPEEVMKEVWAVSAGFPVLLKPVAHGRGVELVRVLGRRGPWQPSFAEARAEVMAELVDERLESRTRELMRELMAKAEIRSHSLAEVMK